MRGSGKEMTDRASRVIIPGIVLATVLGGVFGYYLPEVAVSLGFVGRIFISALKLVAIPLVFCAIIAGIASLRSTGRSGRVAGAALIYFAASSVLAVAIGLGLVIAIQPGTHATLPQTGPPSWVASLPDVGGIIEGIIPANNLAAISSGNLLGVVLLAIAVGIVLIGFGRRAKLVVDVVDIVYQAVIKLIGAMMYAAPVGLFFLCGSIVGSNVGQLNEVAEGLLYLLMTLVSGYVIIALVVFPLVLWLLAGRNPFFYFFNTLPAMATAFATGSSTTALPVTYDCVVERNKVDRGSAGIVLPLGASINMNGTAMFVMVATLFVAQAAGLDLSIMQIGLIALVAAFVPAGLVGIPGAGIVVLVLAFKVADFPQAAYAGLGLILAMDWLFDRLRAKVNVWGDAVGAATVERLAVKVEAKEKHRLVSRHRQDAGGRRPTDRRQGRPTSGGRPSRDNARSRSHDQRSRSDRQDSRDRRQYQDSNRSTSRRTGASPSSGKPPSRYSRENRSRNDRPDLSQTSPFEVPIGKSESVPSQPHRGQQSTPEMGESRRDSSVPDSRRRPPREKTRSEALSSDTIVRERNKVAKQLDHMRKNELKLRDPEEKKSSLSPRTSPRRKAAEATEVSRKSTEPIETKLPKVDFSSDRPKSAPASTSVVETKSAVEEVVLEHLPQEPTTETPRQSGSKLSVKITADDSRKQDDTESTEVKQPTGFGRSRTRRGDALRKQTKSSDSQAAGDKHDKPPEAVAAYTADNLTFGRSRKKGSR